MALCRHCGCDKPCPCDFYSDVDNCQRCGCHNPCECDGYSMGCDHAGAPLSSFDHGYDAPEFSV